MLNNAENEFGTLSGKKLLVTGGAGFIGSNLIKSLLSLKAEVVCLDNFITGKIENIKEFIDNQNFKLINGDIRNFDTCMTACQNIDIVFHQAALGSVPRSIENPLLTNEINISGFLNMIYAAYKSSVKRFVFAASSSTYGDHPGLPKIEENIGQPLSPYAVTKYVNELYASVFKRIYGIETIGLRYFNVFGPHQDPDGPYAAVIPKFIKALIKHQSPVINGNGLHSRDFTYIHNVVYANLLAATTQNEAALNTVYNIACGQSTTLNQLFSILKKAIVKYDKDVDRIEPVYGNERVGDVKHSLASIEKAAKLLNYKPLYDVNEGISNSIEWYIQYFTEG